MVSPLIVHYWDTTFQELHTNKPYRNSTNPTSDVPSSLGSLSLSPKPLNLKPLNPKPLNPKPLKVSRLKCFGLPVIGFGFRYARNAGMDPYSSPCMVPHSIISIVLNMFFLIPSFRAQCKVYDSFGKLSVDAARAIGARNGREGGPHSKGLCSHHPYITSTCRYCQPRTVLQNPIEHGFTKRPKVNSYKTLPVASENRLLMSS